MFPLRIALLTQRYQSHLFVTLRFLLSNSHPMRLFGEPVFGQNFFAETGTSETAQRGQGRNPKGRRALQWY